MNNSIILLTLLTYGTPGLPPNGNTSWIDNLSNPLITNTGAPIVFNPGQ